MFSVLSGWPGGPPQKTKPMKALRPPGLEQSELGREIRCGQRYGGMLCNLTGHYENFGSLSDVKDVMI